MHRPALVLSCVLSPAWLLAADIPAADAGSRPDLDEGGPPEFVLEYDLEESFGRNPRWQDGPRLSVSIGEFMANDFGIFTASFEDEDAEVLMVNLDWQFPYNREMATFGFYAAFGVSYAMYTWDSRTADDFTATTIAPRILLGYSWNVDRWRFELGLQGEYGLGIGDDYRFLAQDFSSEWEPYFAAGLHTAALYSIGEGSGLEFGGFFQVDHRRMRLYYENSLGGSFTDLAKGEAWHIGALAGWRF